MMKSLFFIGVLVASVYLVSNQSSDVSRWLDSRQALLENYLDKEETEDKKNLQEHSSTAPVALPTIVDERLAVLEAKVQTMQNSLERKETTVNEEVKVLAEAPKVETSMSSAAQTDSLNVSDQSKRGQRVIPDKIDLRQKRKELARLAERLQLKSAAIVR